MEQVLLVGCALGDAVQLPSDPGKGNPKEEDHCYRQHHPERQRIHDHLSDHACREVPYIAAPLRRGCRSLRYTLARLIGTAGCLTHAEYRRRSGERHDADPRGARAPASNPSVLRSSSRSGQWMP